MPCADITVDAHNTMLETILSICSVNSKGDSPTCVGSIELCGHQVLLARHPCPAFLCADQAQKTQTIVLAEPYSESSKHRCLSANTEGGGTPGCRTMSSTSELDLTGSPLKNAFLSRGKLESVASPFLITAPEKTHKLGPRVTTFRSKAFGAAVARSIWSRLNLLLRSLPSRDNITPIYLLVDGKDAQGTLLYGLSPLPAACTRSHVYSTGPWTLERLPRLDTLRRLCTGPSVNAYVDFSARAMYEVLTTHQKKKQEHDQDTVTEESAPCLITLCCSWPRPTALLSKPAPDAHTTMTITVPSGDCRGLLYREVRLLTAAVVGLTTKEVPWNMRPAHQPDITDRLAKLFQQHELHRGERTKPAESVAHCSPDDIIAGKLNKDNIDFMDSLWTILSESDSLNDLRAGLTMVFHAVAINHVRPQIHVRNTTQVAVTCRQLMRGQGQEPELGGMEPLVMLVELGICKIRREYTAILQAGDLATAEQLAPFTAQCGTATPHYEDSLLALHKLQLVLYVVACLRARLELPPSVLATYTAQILQEILPEKTSVLQKSFTFSFPLQTSSVKEMLDRASPSSWQALLTSSDRTSSSTATKGAPEGYSSTLQATVTHVPIVCIVDTDDAFGDLSLAENVVLEDNSQTYYCNYVVTVTDTMFM